MNRYIINPFYTDEPDIGATDTGTPSPAEVRSFHRSIDGYEATPLLSMASTAEAIGVEAIYVKDESHRFGLNAFKPLGASYAIFRLLSSAARRRLGRELAPRDLQNNELLGALGPLTFCAATDGNHGRAVAWTARRFGQQAVIYLPSNSAASRVQAIEAEGGRTVLVPGTFDDCVVRCTRDAEEQGWQVVADTAYGDYREIPHDISLGYGTIFLEADEQLIPSDRPAASGDHPPVDLVLLQTGVGGLASAAVRFLAQRYGAGRPKTLCIEPVSSDCFLESIRRGRPSPTRGPQDSVMAGLNCGIPSLTAWPILKQGTNAFLAIEDEWALHAMRAYAHEGIVSGESGASGLAGLLAVAFDPALRELRGALEIGPSTRVLLVNTEGATDPQAYRDVVELDPSSIHRRDNQ